MQAGQVYHGQRDYTLLRAIQGPCYYPAGHLWLYYPFYEFFIQNENSEHIMKLIHYFCHSVLNLLTSLIGYTYFEGREELAQLIPFILVANQDERKEEGLLYNDQFMALL